MNKIEIRLIKAAGEWLRALEWVEENTRDMLTRDYVRKVIKKAEEES